MPWPISWHFSYLPIAWPGLPLLSGLAEGERGSGSAGPNNSPAREAQAESYSSCRASQDEWNMLTRVRKEERAEYYTRRGYLVYLALLRKGILTS